MAIPLPLWGLSISITTGRAPVLDLADSFLLSEPLLRAINPVTGRSGLTTTGDAAGLMSMVLTT
ncbi:hypothetical protein M407DRAFT_244977 [Tulasnella calospora MUT 4182]|uniref:Uncharacterized protein n=1 Tax=Tulasnella calospora MUT 4182 TaxID=1051891 RepID=A0A0C3QDN0_9AGAM|nr:hypothetical protein M407DRAFT_244977 [Tulasnella calospora MUT 4182]